MCIESKGIKKIPSQFKFTVDSFLKYLAGNTGLFWLVELSTEAPTALSPISYQLKRGFSHQFALFLVSCRKNAMFLNHNVPKPQGRT